MVTALKCPNCGASVNFDDSRPSAVTKCAYCSSTIVVPDSLLRQNAPNLGRAAQFEYTDRFANILRLARQGDRNVAIQQLQRETGLGLAESAEIVNALVNHQEVHWATQLAATQKGRDCTLGTGFFFLTLLFLMPLAIGGAILYLVWSQAETEIDTIIESLTIEIPNTPEPTVAASPTPAFASEIMSIGGTEGTGPGFFNDTRWIGLDGEGNIYTADYSDGRIQVFDKAGNFLTTWNADVPIITGFGVGKDGTVYVARSSFVKRFVGMTGEALADLPLPQGIRPRNLFTAADGTLHLFSEQKLLHFSADGTLLAEAPGPAAQIPDYRSPYGHIAVDGAGNRYIVGEYTVYKLAADGRILQTVGSRGQADDQFGTNPSAVAVDGAGRIYASSSGGILIFDANGRYLDRLKLAGYSFDMLFDTDNTLVVMDRNANRVVRYQLNP